MVDPGPEGTARFTVSLMFHTPFKGCLWIHDTRAFYLLLELRHNRIKPGSHPQLVNDPLKLRPMTFLQTLQHDGQEDGVTGTLGSYDHSQGLQPG